MRGKVTESVREDIGMREGMWEGEWGRFRIRRARVGRAMEWYLGALNYPFGEQRGIWGR